MGKIATEKQITDMAKEPESFNPTRLATKKFAEDMYCVVEGNYQPNQCVQLDDVFYDYTSAFVSSIGLELNNMRVAPTPGGVRIKLLESAGGNYIMWDSGILGENHKVFPSGSELIFKPSSPGNLQYNLAYIKVEWYGSDGVSGVAKVLDELILDFGWQGEPNEVKFSKGQLLNNVYLGKTIQGFILEDPIHIGGRINYNDGN